MRTLSHHARRRIGSSPGPDLAVPIDGRVTRQAGAIRRLLGREAAPQDLKVPTPFGREGRSSVCACGGSCPGCRAASGAMALFQRDEPAASQGQDAPARTPTTDVQGFAIDEQFCDCDFQVEDEIEWVRQMADIFEACKRESDGTAEDAIRCKLRKLDERGIETVLAGSVDEQANVNVAEWPGLCGPIFQYSVALHEGTHRDFLAHGEAPEGAGAAPKRLRDLSEVSARAYAADEVKAYRREERFLEKILKELNQRCLPVRHRIANPEYYREVCGQLGLELGLDMAPGDAWSRTQIHDSWPGLKGKCWWYLGPPGGGYNCYGHCVRGAGEPRDLSPGQSNQTPDEFFADHGYVPSGPTGDIALFSESHAARRSSYSFDGRQLWESKLSLEAPLILHELEDIEGDAYGKVIGFYSRTNE
jgi:hypothetical protein